MIVTQTGVIDVPNAAGTILEIRETNSYQRTFTFHNLIGASLSLEIQASADGGGTWATVGTAFTLAAGAIEVKNVAVAYASSILRVRGSGGAADDDLAVTFVRMYIDSNNIWVAPIL